MGNEESGMKPNFSAATVNYRWQRADGNLSFSECVQDDREREALARALQSADAASSFTPENLTETVDAADAPMRLDALIIMVPFEKD